MPEGVEHKPVNTKHDFVKRAFPSLMPEGVEHLPTAVRWAHLPTAFPSLMPEGVEHSCHQHPEKTATVRFLR